MRTRTATATLAAITLLLATAPAVTHVAGSVHFIADARDGGIVVSSGQTHAAPADPAPGNAASLAPADARAAGIDVFRDRSGSVALDRTDEAASRRSGQVPASTGTATARFDRTGMVTAAR